MQTRYDVFYISDTPRKITECRASAEKGDREDKACISLPRRADGWLAAVICTAMLGVSFLCASPLVSGRGGLDAAVSAVGAFIADRGIVPVFSELEEDGGAAVLSGDIPVISYAPYKSAQEYIASPPKPKTEFCGIMPASGNIISDFSYREDPLYTAGGERWDFHNGIDIPLTEGSEVRAFADGTVKETGESPSYGIYTVITHANGFESTYAHLSRAIRGVGAQVKQGEVIAYSGKTGRVTGAHLHFELRKDGVPVDPEGYIK
jgi:murein DD-endopeptidase MepM/ murein hydrolase activator NlpD